MELPSSQGQSNDDCGGMNSYICPLTPPNPCSDCLRLNILSLLPLVWGGVQFQYGSIKPSKSIIKNFDIIFNRRVLLNVSITTTESPVEFWARCQALKRIQDVSACSKSTQLSAQAEIVHHHKLEGSPYETKNQLTSEWLVTIQVLIYEDLYTRAVIRYTRYVAVNRK